MTTRTDPSTAEIRSALSVPAPTDRLSLNRRTFLQATAAMSGAAMLPMWLGDQAAAASPIGPADGVLVLITMNGGVDGLSMVAPVNNGTYHDLRGGLALSPGNAHALNNDRILHPALPAVKSYWDLGNVAFIEGVGDVNGSLSHFEQMARVMTAKSNDGAMTSGWLGRYVDGLPGGADPFHSVCFGSSIPLVVQGNNRRATAVGTQPRGLVDINTADDYIRRELEAIADFSNSSTGQGALADSLAAVGPKAIDLASRILPTYNPALPGDRLAAEMTLCARLINANLGIRVFSIDFGDFDGHADHNELHEEGFVALNAAIDAFFGTLNRQYADQVLLVTATEFGRRLKANRGGGTDHGNATTLMAIGSQVNGGLYGEMPSFTNLDSNRNLRPTVDYRAVYGTVLGSWLKADQGQILGQNYEDLGFVAAPATKALAPPPSVADGLAMRNEVIRLYLAYFLRMPDTPGLDHWISVRRTGMALADISNNFAASAEFQNRYGTLDNGGFVDLVYQNVLGRQPDGEGRNYWVGQLNAGVSRGAVMTGFSESAEFRNQTASTIAEFDRTGPIARLYAAYFLRDPDTDGLEYWSSTGLSLGVISQAFAESPEFVNRYGSLNNDQFVDLVYRNVLNRPPEGEGLQYWSGELRNGATRGAVMIGFSESAEFVASFTG